MYLVQACIPHPKKKGALIFILVSVIYKTRVFSVLKIPCGSWIKSFRMLQNISGITCLIWGSPHELSDDDLTWLTSPWSIPNYPSKVTGQVANDAMQLLSHEALLLGWPFLADVWTKDCWLRVPSKFTTISFMFLGWSRKWVNGTPMGWSRHFPNEIQDPMNICDQPWHTNNHPLMKQSLKHLDLLKTPGKK